MNDARLRSFGTAHSTLCIILVIWILFFHRTCFRRHRILVRWVEIRMHALANPNSWGMMLFFPVALFSLMHLLVPTMMMPMMVVALPGQKIDFDTGLCAKVTLLLVMSFSYCCR